MNLPFFITSAYYYFFKDLLTYPRQSDNNYPSDTGHRCHGQTILSLRSLILRLHVLKAKSKVHALPSDCTKFIDSKPDMDKQYKRFLFGKIEKKNNKLGLSCAKLRQA